MRGEKVIAKVLGGVPTVLRVWDVGDGVVYLASETEFRKREAGHEALEPIGFPASDVFAYDEAFLEGKQDWRKLIRWKPVRLVV